IEADQRQQTRRRAQRDRRRPCAIHDAHDISLRSAILEELLDRVGQRGGLPQTAEMVLELREAADEHRVIDGALQSSPDEGCRSGGCACDRTLRSALFCEFYAAGAGDSALSHWFFFAASRPFAVDRLCGTLTQGGRRRVVNWRRCED